MLDFSAPIILSLSTGTEAVFFDMAESKNDVIDINTPIPGMWQQSSILLHFLELVVTNRKRSHKKWWREIMTGEMIKLHVGPSPHPLFFRQYQLLSPPMMSMGSSQYFQWASKLHNLLWIRKVQCSHTHTSVTLNFLTCGAAFRSNHSAA